LDARLRCVTTVSDEEAFAINVCANPGGAWLPFPEKGIVHH